MRAVVHDRYGPPEILRVDVVEPAPGAPVAVQDTALLPVGGSVLVDVLANDEDPTGALLAVQQVEGQVLQPVLMRRSVALHPAVVLLAIVAKAWLNRRFRLPAGGTAQTSPSLSQPSPVPRL